MPNRHGFTLVEILIVLAILAVIVPVFLTVAAYTTDMNNEARLRASAILQAEGLLERLVAETATLTEMLGDQDIIEWPGTGLASPFAWPLAPPFDWKWQAMQGEQVPAGLIQIDVWVTWQYRGKDRQVQVVTYGG